MCDLDGDGYVDKSMFTMIKKNSNVNIPVKNWKHTDEISREDLIKSLEDEEFIKQLKPFNLADYFKKYESLVDLQLNDVGNLSRILRACDSRHKLKEKVKSYTGL